MPVLKRTPTTKTMVLSAAASAVLDAYNAFNQDSEGKGQLGSSAIIAKLFPQLPEGTQKDLARIYPELQNKSR